MFKRIFLLAILISTACLGLLAQPTTVKNAAKSVFTLTTYNANGDEIMKSNGFFIGKNGECVSILKPFIGADKAIITDYKGNQMNVSRILGINELYDVIRFSVDGKTTPLPLAEPATQGSKVWLVGYGDKNPTITPTTIKSVEKFMDKYSYYIFSLTPPDNTTACPFVNEQGYVIGLMQTSQTTFDTYATDARYISNLQISGMSINETSIKRIGIPTALPTDKTQALVALMMAEQNTDSIKKIAAINDFIQLYPTLVDGYAARAQMYVNSNDFDNAEKDMETAIKKAEPKDEVHFRYSKLIYYKELYKNDIEYKPWSLDKAMDEAKRAYELNPQPLYEHHQAQILFAKGEYQTAYDIFTKLQNSTLRNGELFYEASRCKLMLKAPTEEIIALLDSAIANTDSINAQAAANYFYARAEAYEDIEKYREAVFDYTRYEYLMNRRVNPVFYYIREQAEIKAKLYKQALTDITIAIITNPDEPIYFAEKASLELKVNMLDDCIKTANECIKRWPEYSDGYLLLGLARIHNNEKTEGLKDLEKAKQLGNNQADALIEKYSK